MKTFQLVGKKFVLTMTALFVVLLGIASTGCSDNGSDAVVVDAPQAPTAFMVEVTEGTLAATLTWTAPTAGGEVATYEIYRSTTAGGVFDADNHLISIPAEAGKTDYEFVDNAGLTRNTDTYWVVAAKNAGGETPTNEVMEHVGGGEMVSSGNNFASALIFADGYGISGLLLDENKSWTNNLADIDFNTGLRPSSEQTFPAGTLELPYFDPSTTYVLDDVTYYKQQTASTWQGEWKNGADAQQHVSAKWGDNLISQSLTINSVIRIEMVLSEALSTPMTSYNMVSLYGTQMNEIQGTDGVEYNNTTAFVFATNAHLSIQKLDNDGNPYDPLYSQTLWEGDGPGFLAAEVNVAGNFTYGFVWNLKDEDISGEPYGKSGTWRITFSLDGTSPRGTSNNTFIDTAVNGELDSNTSAHIDIHIQ